MPPRRAQPTFCISPNNSPHFLPRDYKPKRSHERQRISLVRSVGQTLSSAYTAFQPPVSAVPNAMRGACGVLRASRPQCARVRPSTRADIRKSPSIAKIGSRQCLTMTNLNTLKDIETAMEKLTPDECDDLRIRRAMADRKAGRTQPL